MWARFLRPVNMFIRDDFPTFERPIKAYSRLSETGHFDTVELLISNFALLIFIS